MGNRGVFEYCIIWLVIIGLSQIVASNTVAATESNKNGVLLSAMKEELNRSMAELKKQGKNAPYFIGYRIVEVRSTAINASYGALTRSSQDVSRLLNVNVRVGSYKLDNTHPLRDRFEHGRYSSPVKISIEDNADSIKSTLWQQTDKKYKEAVEKLIKVQSDKAVKTTEENPSDDFSQEYPEASVTAPQPLTINKAEWEKLLKKYSSLLKRYPFIYHSSVSLWGQATVRYIVSTEGTEVQTADNHVSIHIALGSKAEDGMELHQYESFDARTPEGLPSEKVMVDKIRKMAENLRLLRTAPLVEPYNGPAILSGQAAGVFFHEIFGHRIEGHRQKDEKDGQTFARKMNENILPSFISVYDDPTVLRINDHELNGHYRFDDEGVKAQRVSVVESGVLKNFLMSRSPFMNFNKSNGHGRAQAGLEPVSRQGNLIIQCMKTMPYTKLREMLIEECKKQKKAFGLIFQKVEGGFTMTGRMIPNAFNVRPILVYRIYTDGRSDELIRGVDLIGTPLTPFNKIIAASDTVDVFNGYCGAESGSVTVSAVSPALLVSEIEVQKKEKATAKLPILPPPFYDKQAN
ncbi:MAG: TldD/PmbA family protein [Syntrophaceae bacterium]